MIRPLRTLLLLTALAGLAVAADRTVGRHPPSTGAISPLLAEAGRGARPNIVVLFADDLGYGDLASYGHPTHRTPHLDRMAAEGVRLTSFYSAAPVCTPSRAALLTGRYPIRSGMQRNRNPHSEDGLPQAEVTLAEALRKHGYRTAAIGKWHLGHRPGFLPTAHGFDSFLGIPYSNDMDKVDKGHPPVPLLRDTTVIEQPVEQGTLTQRLTDEAVRVIRESGGGPFFIYLAHPMPHLPLWASDEFRGRSRSGAYGDVIAELDSSTGRILEALRRQGVDRNTIVVFASDNGPWLDYPDSYATLYGTRPSHAGSPGLLRGSKATTYEGGLRVPGIVRWPEEIPAGGESAEMITTMDLYATLLRAAGADLPRDRVVDGQDVLPVLRGGAPTLERPFYYFLGERLQAVRQGRWKLRLATRGPDGLPAPELFDLEADPGERFNLAVEQPAVVERLRQTLHAFAREVGAGGP